MLKRLLTAVLVLGVLFAFNGTAFSNPSDIPRDLDPKDRDLPTVTGTTSKAQLQPGQVNTPNKSWPRVQALPTAADMTPGAPAPDTTQCFFQDYYSAYFTGIPCYAYLWGMEDGTGTPVTDQIAVRYDNYNYPLYVADVYQVAVRVSEASHLGGAGVPIRVSVYDDAGGLPNALMGFADFALPYLAVGGSGAFVTLVLPTPITVAGGAYHVSVGYGPTAAFGDTLTLRSTSGNDFGCTNAVSGRSTYYYAGTWYDLPTLFGDDTGYDWGLRVWSCEHYTQCFTQMSFGGYVWLWAVPDPAWSTGSTLNGMAQRFVATGPDTLKTVRWRHYYLNDGAYTGASTNGVEISVWGDNAGMVDYASGPLATVTLPGGVGLFPNTGLGATTGWNTLDIDFSSFNLVLLGAFHLSAKMTSDVGATGVLYFATSFEGGGPNNNDQTGMSSNFTGDTCPWQLTTGAAVGCTTVATWDTDLGLDLGFLIGSVRCKDEFYTCQHQATHDGYFNTAWGLGYAAIGFSRRAVSQMIQGGVGGAPNRVEKIGFVVADDALFGDPCCTNGTPSLKVSIDADNGAMGPGATLWSTTLTYAQLSPTINGWTEVVIPGGFVVPGNFYVTAEIAPTDSTAEYWYFGGDRMVGSHTSPPHIMFNGGMWQLRNDPIANYWQNRHAAAGDLANAIFEVDFCSIPPNEATCATPDVWPTAGHDYQRTNHSNVALSDAYCDLTLNWLYQHPTQLATFVGPIIDGNEVVMSFTAEYKILDLATGAVLSTLNDPGIMGSTNIRCIPTIATVGGIRTLFVAGGSQNAVAAYDITNPALPVERWRIGPTNGWAGLGNIGVARYTNFTVQTVAGTEIVIFGTDGGKVFAVDANLGTAYAPWGVGLANATNVGGSTLASGATDGVRYYCGTKIDGLNADLFALSLVDGSIVWQLSTSAGLQGTVVYPGLGAGAEGFDATVAVTPDDGTVWANATMGIGNHPTDGVFYRLNSASGALKSAVASNSSFGGVSNPIIDQNRVYIPTRSRWVTPPSGGFLLAFSRYTGTLSYATYLGADDNAGPFRTNGVLTCETGAPDQLFVFSDNGYLSCVNADNGDEIYHRRIDHLSASLNIGGAGAAAPGHLVFGDRYGDVIDMSKQTDRARLEILHYAIALPVPFGSPNPTMVTVPNVYTNTGCVALNVASIAFSDVTNGQTPGAAMFSGVSDDAMANASSIANNLAANAASFAKWHPAAKGDEMLVENREIAVKPALNKAAAAVPPFINVGVIGPFVIPAGDTADIILNVNGPLVNRGPNVAYAQFTTDDPDFWLGTSALLPEVKITLVGGCLIDTTALNFGAASANMQWVTNTGRLGTGDWTPHAFDIDGEDAIFYQGTYLFGVDSFRLAMNTQDWSSGGGENDAWISMQPDPNFCDGDCKPALTTGATLGAVSLTGVGLYTPLVGNIICKSYIDSVQNFDDGTGWYWRWYGAPFDDTLTMGLYCNSKTFAVEDAPVGFELLNNVTVEVMKFFPRFGQAVPGWKFASDIDYDVGTDTAAMDQSISTVWSFNANKPATGDAYGMVKLPFGGCGIAPMKNVRALQSLQGQFEDTDGRGNPYWDSAYYYMSLPSGSMTSQNIRQSGGDQQMHATFIEHDFTGNDTLVFGVAHFGFLGLTNPHDGSNYAALARLVNKWVGYGRGDVNNDNTINLADIVYLTQTVAGGPGAIPFAHLSDVNADGATDAADVTFLVNYYFNYGDCPSGAFIVGL
ncbi:MAG: PQQ-binding-like beta-propeller repeat protein [Candidatus Zixiibacteriota bacterium]